MGVKDAVTMDQTTKEIEPADLLDAAKIVKANGSAWYQSPGSEVDLGQLLQFGMVVATPLIVEVGVPIQMLAYRVRTAGSAGTVLRAAICPDDKGWPKNEVAVPDLGTIACDTTGVKEWTIAGNYTPVSPRVWAILVCQGSGTPAQMQSQRGSGVLGIRHINTVGAFHSEPTAGFNSDANVTGALTGAWAYNRYITGVVPRVGYMTA